MNGKKARDFHHELRNSYQELKRRLSDKNNPFIQPTASYKEYRRSLKIHLLPQTNIDANLSETITTRVTQSSFSETHLSLQDLSNLIGTAIGRRYPSDSKSPFRHYPSGGALYPVETYLLLEPDVVDGIKAGVYHYNALSHTLELCSDSVAMQQAKAAMNINREVPIIFMLSAYWERNMQKYGDFGYKIILLETGHIAQNLILCARGLGLQSWQFVNFEELSLNKALDFEDRHEEDVIYCIGMGVSSDETK